LAVRMKEVICPGCTLPERKVSIWLLELRKKFVRDVHYPKGKSGFGC